MKWTDEEINYLKILLKDKKSLNEITEAFEAQHHNETLGFYYKRSRNSIRCKMGRMSTQEIETDYYENRWSSILNVADQYRLDSVHKDLGLTTNVARKILSFSDLHIPFFLSEDMYAALDQHLDADIIVLNGDILDGYIFSTFSKAKRIAAIKEYQAAYNLVHWLSDNFENIIIVSGNHDSRSSKVLARSGFEKEATQVFRPDLLSRIANGEELDDLGNLITKRDFANVHYQLMDSWYVRVGKTIFAHPDGFASRFPGATAVKLYDHFSAAMHQDDFDSIVVGHTHKIYKGIYAGKLLIEQGAMAHRLPYQFKTDLRFKNAMNGYAVIYQDSDGNTNFNLSTPVYLGTHVPVKKEILK